MDICLYHAEIGICPPVFRPLGPNLYRIRPLLSMQRQGLHFEAYSSPLRVRRESSTIRGITFHKKNLLRRH